MQKENQVKTLYMKFYCQTLHNHWEKIVSQHFNTPPPSPRLKSPLQLTFLFLFKLNAVMNYHDGQWRNNEGKNLDLNFSVLKPF